MHGMHEQITKGLMYAFWTGNTHCISTKFYCSEIKLIYSILVYTLLTCKSLYLDFYTNLSQLLLPQSLQYVIITNIHSKLDRTYVVCNIMSFAGKPKFHLDLCKVILGRKCLCIFEWSNVKCEIE